MALHLAGEDDQTQCLEPVVFGLRLKQFAQLCLAKAAHTCASRWSGALGAAQAALLQCVAVLFMIFQVPSMRSSVCKSTHPSNRSSAWLTLEPLILRDSIR